MQGRANISKWGEEWAVFGGGIEEGETPEQAITREMQEELELDFPSPKVLGSFCADHSGKNTKVHYFALEIEGTENLVLHEGSEMRFFSFEETKNLKLHPAHHKVIELVQKVL